MSDRIKALKEERAKLVAEARELLDAAANEKRELTTEEESRYDTVFAEAEKKGSQIEREERQRELDRKIAESVAHVEDRNKQPDSTKTPEELRMAAFDRYLRHGAAGLTSGEGVEEFRAYQADNDPEGGFLASPQQFVSELLKEVDDAVFVRQNARVFQVNNAESLGVPSLDADPGDADWTVELGTGNEDNDMRFGKRELKPHPLAKRVKLSKKLIRNSALPIESLVRERLAYKFGITTEKAYLTGNGQSQPLGIFTASSDGVSTARDVSTDNTATAITFDGLKEAKYFQKAQYWGRSRWLFHRDAIKMLSKIKDGEGQYIWQPSVSGDVGDQLLEMPLDVSEYVPNTFTTGLYVGALCDWSHYWIADAMNLEMQRLEELYAETNQVGLIGRLESDGMPVLEEAFVRVKLA
jgi:HK97 family phage major capsid protein